MRIIPKLRYFVGRYGIIRKFVSVNLRGSFRPPSALHRAVGQEVPVLDHVVVGLDPIRRTQPATQADFVVLAVEGV